MSNGHKRHRRAAEGLTAREREVLELLATGKPQTEIAKLLVIELCTVQEHVKNIRNKTGARNAFELAVKAARGEI